ncbi:oocyte zinc finger protein XlCOF28 isoform X2 [Bicyclus anynana]|uniref:Oocyte zinc finger protein XlCOF28 isoform X2 n=1 Tax=Bicyclus anynana TaxID=110368 RepID=A0ABM3LL43_BICAN|nr:oocyte zinc finger protein XlCOF28 isoform X2 [Bicyclus anynana]
MNSQVCVNCYNKKTVNQTDNRLVTESCGHVKCMDCLLHEKFGCEACKRNGCEEEVLVSKPESDAGEKSKTYTVTVEYEEVPRDEQELLKKKKLDISHIKAEEKEKKYSCKECSKSFNSLSAVRKHTLTHTDERPFACATCARRFRDSSNYKKHVHKHKRLCQKCGEELPVGKGAEKQHQCSPGATGPRPHPCPRCRKSFHSKKDMRRHAAIHSDSKPYRCKLCPEDRCFRRKDNLERHVRNAHPDCSPSSAYECDLTALQSLTEAGADTYEKSEKTKLEILNPLPPLPQEVINKHIEEANNKESNVNTSVTEVKHNEVSKTSECVVDKKSIIEANNARESVIVEKRPSDCEKKVPSPENEYVHKIRKAIIPLPPIDQEKFRSVQRGHLPDSGTVKPITNMDIYKKILFEKVEKDTTEVIQNPKMHWRRKMEQDIN